MLPRLESWAWIVGMALILPGLGCRPQPPVTSNYDADDRVTAYKTDRVPLPSIEWGSTLGGGASVSVQAQAWCLGRECTPQQVSLVFHVSGGTETFMNDRSVEIVADGRTLYSGDGGQREELKDQKIPSVGVIAVADLRYQRFRTLATAEEVRGAIGTSEFTISYSDRAPLRAFLEATK